MALGSEKYKKVSDVLLISQDWNIYQIKKNWNMQKPFQIISESFVKLESTNSYGQQ